MNRHMRFGLSIALMMMVVCLLNASETTKTYTHDELGFSIEYPSAWNKTDVQGGNIMVLFTGGAINRNVQVMYDEGGEEGGMAALEKLAAILGSQQEISAEWKEINGRRAYHQVAEWTSILGGNKAIRLIVPAADHYFLVMAVCPTAEYDDLHTLLEKCILSFKIID